MTSIRRSRKYYTYLVSVSLQLQFTFPEIDVEPAEEGGENDVDPTEEALAELEKELFELLSQDSVVQKLEAYADFGDLLGVDEGPA